MTDAICVLPHHVDADRPRRALDGAYVCAGHYDRLWRLLTELPTLYHDCALPDSSTTGGPKVSGTPTSRLPFNPKKADVRRAIHQKMAGWVRIVANERGISISANTVPAIIDWLTRHHDWLCAQPYVDDYALDLEDLHPEAFAAAYPDGKRRVNVGACPLLVACDVATRTELRCPGCLVGVYRMRDDLLPAELVCTACGTATPPHAWPALGRRIDRAVLAQLHRAPYDVPTAAELRLIDGDSWLTAVELGRLWGRPIGTVQYWAHQDGWRRDYGRPTRYHAGDAQQTHDTRVGGDLLAV